ncbi:MAG: BlaI/MecI/CopY family transcriptional regulator [Myxococcales bacterium FL481]|nr:MAG: BlaI/MecI/CopY family transcriptional regulator [Myxococcales bacterium FL481]
MPLKPTPSFSRREREIMDVMHLLGPATAAEIHAEMADPPTYSSVRATLRRLEEKGHVKHRDRGHRNVYAPVVSQTRARRAAARQLIETYFGGSVGAAVAGLLDSVGQKRIPRDEVERASAALARVRTKA